MNRPAPRSIDEYLKQLRTALAAEDPALIQDALYDAEEYLRAELGAHPGKSEADVLELIASTYGAPDEVAAAYRDTEAKVKAALRTPPPARSQGSALQRFFSVFSDTRAYSSLFFMLLSLATGIIYFTFAVTGLSLSAGLAILIIGVPFFLAFIGISRVISLGEGRLLEAMTGERMPRRPAYSSVGKPFTQRLLDMLRDSRTWTTILYFVLMLPIGIIYFVIATVGLALSLSFTLLPVAVLGDRLNWWHVSFIDGVARPIEFHPAWAGSVPLLILMAAGGVLLLTILMHVARGIGRTHARVAKSMLVPAAGA